MSRRGAEDARQASLLDAPEPPPRPLFFALWPDDAVRDAVAAQAGALRARLGPGGDWLPPAKYHLTLHHLELAAPQQAALQTALPRIVARLPRGAFRWQPDRVDSFHGRPGNHPCVLRAAEDPAALLMLWQALREALILEGFGRALGRGGFTPHVTLAYLPRPLAEPQPLPPLDWNVDRLALLRSVPAGEDYPCLGEWPLR